MVENALMHRGTSGFLDRCRSDDSSGFAPAPDIAMSGLRDASGERSVWEWLSRSFKLPDPTIAR